MLSLGTLQIGPDLHFSYIPALDCKATSTRGQSRSTEVSLGCNIYDFSSDVMSFVVFDWTLTAGTVLLSRLEAKMSSEYALV